MRRRVSALLAVALLASGVVAVHDTPPASAQTQETVIWSATLTVGSNFFASGTQYGCHRFADTTADECVTRLTSATFALEGNSYTVGELHVQPDATKNPLAFAMDSSLTAQQFADFRPLVLRVDGHEYRIAVSSGAHNGWQWDTDNADTGPVITSLSTKSTVAVQLLATGAAGGLPGTPGPVPMELVAVSHFDDVVNTYLGGAADVVVVEHEGKRFAAVAGQRRGPHLLDITDPDNIDPLLLANTQDTDTSYRMNNILPSSDGFANAVDAYTVGGRPYFILGWSGDSALQAFKIRQSDEPANNGSALAVDSQVGRLMRANLAQSQIIDTSRLRGIEDLFIYSVGAKQYAVVAAFTNNRLTIADVTDPNNLGGTVVGSIADDNSRVLGSPTGAAYYRKGDKHYALVSSDGSATTSDKGIQIVDISDPTSPTAAGSLADTNETLLSGANNVAVYSVGGRSYAVVSVVHALRTQSGLQIVDITDPDNLVATGQLKRSSNALLENPKHVEVIAIEGRHYAAVADTNLDAVSLIDVTNPNRPFGVASISDGQNGAEELDGAENLTYFQDNGRHYLIVAARKDHGVQILEIKIAPPSGALDPAFGHGGIATAAFGQSASEIFDMVEQPDGKIVAVGFANNVNAHGNTFVASKDFALARYNPDGSLDPSFGVGGRVLTDFTVIGSHNGGDDEARAVALQSDGKIVVAGYAANPNLGKEFVVARYNEDGTLDTTFGPAISGSKRGFAIHNFASGAQDDVANAVAVQTVGGNEHILVAGQSGTSFGLVRYNSIGGLDTGFGTVVNQSTRTGSQTIAFSTLEDGATSLAVDSSNKIVVAGFATDNNGTTTVTTALPDPTVDDHKNFALARISTAGDLDSTFGTSGKVTSDLLLGSIDQVNAVAVQSDGKIVAAGLSGTSGGAWALARYTTAGVLDDGFGSLKGGMQSGREGYLLPNRAAGDPSAQLTDVALQSDGRIVAAGYSTHATDPDAGLLLRVSAVGDVESAFGEAFTGDFYPASPAPGSERGDRDARIQALALLDGGGMALGGFVNTGSLSEFAMIAVTGTGELSTDAGFGLGGVVTTSFGSVAITQAMAVQSDNKIVVAGYVDNINATPLDTSDDHNDFAVARFNANGTLDTGFGTQGWVTTDIGTGTNDTVSAVAIDSSGRIIVAGAANNGDNYESNDFAVVRYTSAGALDTTFSTDGKLTTDFNSQGDLAFAVAVDSAGRIIVGGVGGGADGLDDLGLARYTTAGALDTTFATDGKLTTDIANETASIQGLAIAGDGKIVAAGQAHSGINDDFLVARYTSAGALDTTFGDVASGATKKGFVTTAVATGGTDGAQAVTLDTEGRIVAAGWTTNDAGTPGGASDADDDYTEFALARYTSAGVLDTSFNSDGTVTLGFGTTGIDKAGRAVDIDAKGRIIVGGNVAFGTSERAFALARFNADGTLDTDFGIDGKVTTDFGSTRDIIYGVAAQPMSGGPRILAAGRSGGEFRLARYRATPPQSTEATLSALALNTSTDGSAFGGTATLSPAFDSATAAYAATLRSDISHYRVTPTAADGGATVTVDGTIVASGTSSAAVAVSPGTTTTVTVVVTAEDGFNTETYTIAVSALSGDATLSSLLLNSKTNPAAVSFTGTGVLEPAFDAAVTSYASTLLPDVVAVQVTPTAADANATITVQGNTLASGTGSQPISVTLGTTATVTVVVTAQDDQITNTYTIVITVGNAASLTVAPNPVGEGAEATVTVTITEAQTNDITIPLVVTAGSAESSDFDAPSEVPIAAGDTSGSVALSTFEDPGASDETLTVTLGSPLPADLQPGSPSMVAVTIDDDEEFVVPRSIPLMVFVETGDASLTAVWTLIDEDQEIPTSLPTSFDIEYRVKGTTAFTTLNVAADTVVRPRADRYSHVISGLVNGTTYQVRVRVRNEAGAAPPSQSIKEGTPLAPPTAPSGVTANPGPRPHNTIVATWNPVAATAAQYQVRYRAQGATNWHIYSTRSDARPTTITGRAGPRGQTGHYLTGFTSSTTYEIQVRAFIVNSIGPWSATATATTHAAPPPTNTPRPDPTNTGGSPGGPTGGNVPPPSSGDDTGTGDSTGDDNSDGGDGTSDDTSGDGNSMSGDAGDDSGEGDSGDGDAEQFARSAASRFEDVAINDFYAAPVGWLLRHEITSGCTTDRFCAESPTSRQDFVTFLWRAAGRPAAAQPGSATFTDVTAGHYADAAIGWALDQNITIGCGTGDDGSRLFCPGDQVTRGQIAAFLYRYTGATAEPQNAFSDVAPTSFYASAVTWMSTHNITTGCNNSTDNLRFCPNDPATRAQVATFLHRMSTTPQSWGPNGGILAPDRTP